jgi:hypothetical protein
MNNPSQLRNLLHQRQIVQHYPPEDLLPLPLPFPLPHARHFFEEQIFEELERTAIVEDYLPRLDYAHSRMEEEEKCWDLQPIEPEPMDEERIQEEPYEELFAPIASRCTLPQKMLDSASSGRELPSRNSSISSISSCDHPVRHPPLGLRAQASRGDGSREERKGKRR